MSGYLIKNGTVITVDPSRRIIEAGAVAVDGRKIVAVGTSQELSESYGSLEEIDASNMIVLPGLIDLHGHAGNALVRSLGDQLTGAGWRELMDFITYRASDIGWWRTEATLAASERLSFGTTTSLFMLGTSPRADDARIALAHADAYEEVGVRACIGVGPSRPPWPRKFSMWDQGIRRDYWRTLDQCFDITREAIQTWRQRNSELVELWVSVSRFLNPNPLDPVHDSSQDQFIRPQAEGVRGLLDDLGARAHIHAYGNAIEYAHDEGLGLLGPDVVLAHCTGITDKTLGFESSPRSLAILKETDTRIAHNPRSRRTYSFDGRCPVTELIDEGVTVGLGSDGPAPQNNFDLFLDMKMTAMLQRLHHRDPFAMPPGKILEMATIDAARAIGRESTLGSLEPGKDADIILVDWSAPHVIPRQQPVHRIVYSATGNDVKTVLVNGKVVLADRSPANVSYEELNEQVSRAFDLMMSRADLGWLLEQPAGLWGSSKY